MQGEGLCQFHEDRTLNGSGERRDTPSSKYVSVSVYQQNVSEIQFFASKKNDNNKGEDNKDFLNSCHHTVLLHCL